MLSPTPTRVAPWHVDSSHSKVDFVAHHMGISTIQGRFGRLTAEIHVDERDLARSFVRASIDVSSIDTNSVERDKHLRDLFEAARFPTATFESKRVATGGAHLEVTGPLTIHGITREVTLEVEAKPHDGRVTFSGKTAISRKDFGLQWSAPIEWTSGVSDRVELELRLEAVRR